MSIFKNRLLNALILTLACFCTWGCDHFEEETKLLESGFRRDYGFVMVSDTTAVIPVHNYDHYERDWNDWNECTNVGISLVDSRSFSGATYWKSLLDSCPYRRDYTPPPIGSLEDSVVIFPFRDKGDRFIYYVWKINEESEEKQAIWKDEISDIFSSHTIIRRWKNGKVLFKCHDNFILLDTAANTITQITKKDAGWPDDVEDAQYFGDELMTLHFISENHCEFGIMRNLTDLVAVHRVDSCEGDFLSPRFNGKYISTGYSSFNEKYNVYGNGALIFSTDSAWQISEKPVARYYNDQFQILDKE